MTPLPDQSDAIEVGQMWRRIGGKQRVSIRRVWTICGCDSDVMHAYRPEHGSAAVTALRARPTHGGEWWTVAPEFLKRYQLDSLTPDEEEV